MMSSDRQRRYVQTLNICRHLQSQSCFETACCVILGTKYFHYSSVITQTGAEIRKEHITLTLK